MLADVRIKEINEWMKDNKYKIHSIDPGFSLVLYSVDEPEDKDATPK